MIAPEITETERVAAVCHSGQGHIWVHEEGDQYRCIDCDQPTVGPPVGATR